MKSEELKSSLNEQNNPGATLKQTGAVWCDWHHSLAGKLDVSKSIVGKDSRIAQILMRKTFNMLKRGGLVKQSLEISEEQLASNNL